MGDMKTNDNPSAELTPLKPQASSLKPTSYTVLARRYRSRDFDELIGQEPIVRTLRNAVKSGRAAHAYLFCGSRGVGKTSMARILARALNVTDDLVQADEITDAILRGDDLDVVEIDGASNRGVNEARDLIAAAVLSPARCRYKIYIIDEVHMLTSAAFNTLLKTMEEPPAHVKFILCTTDPVKVPATIQSRCQRFDFRLLPASLIGEHLRAILKQEEVEADDEVVAQIARMGRGSVRDALSLLDRLLAAGEERLTASLMEQMLGLPDQTLAARLVDAIAAGDSDAALRDGAALLDRGASVDQALEMLIERFRDLMLIAACGAECELVELSEEARTAAVEQARSFDAAGLVHLIAVCDSAARNARGSEVSRAIFDAVLVRLCESERLADVAALLEGSPKAARVQPKKKAEPVADGSTLWEKVRSLAADSPSDHARVEHLVYRTFDGRTLRLSVETDDSGLGSWLSTQTVELADMVRRATSMSVHVEIEAKPRPTPGRPAGASQAGGELERAEQLPLVRAAMEIFDATVVDVKDVKDV